MPSVGDIQDTGTGQDEGPGIFRPSGISYLHIPAPDPASAAAFYHDVFGWTVREDPEHPAFADGTGHVIGHWTPDLPVAEDSGVVPCVYVESVDATLTAVRAHGGAVAAGPYPEGDLWVATCRDPAGNVIGVWQRGPRN